MMRLRTGLRANRWLDPANPYRTDVVARIKERTAEGRRIQDPYLIEYIAASAVVHCFDGWSFLGRALEAEMAGDPDAARHLGYYAELRAAMSTLASQGIGVFDKIHIVVDDSGDCLNVRRAGPTHRFVWLALEHWASDKAYDVLFKIVGLSGIPLATWLEQFHPAGSGVRPLAVDLIKRWGLDLRLLAADREDRNIASYRPTAFVSSGPREIEMVAQTVAAFWKLCRPTESSLFDGIDLLLLRHSLEFVFSRSHPRGRGRRQAPRQYERRIGKMLSGVGLSDAGAGTLRTRLLDSREPGRELLSDAGKRGLPSDMDRSKQVLARATLLLRVATGCAKELLAEIGGAADTRDLLRFWWSGASVNRRLWDEPAPDSFGDLWQDAGDAIEDVEAWLAESRPARSRSTSGGG